MPISIPARRARLEKATKGKWTPKLIKEFGYYYPWLDKDADFLSGMANEESEMLEELDRLEKENDEVNEEADELQAAMIKYRDEARERETAWCAFKEAVEKARDMGLDKSADYDKEIDAALALAPKEE